MNLSSHRKRLLTAFSLLPLILLAINAGGDWLFAMVLAVSWLGLWEFYSLFWSGPDMARNGLGKKTIGLTLAAVFLAAARAENPHLIVAVVLASFWCGNLYFLFWYGLRPQRANYLNALIMVGGLLYLPFTMQFFLFFRPAEIYLVLLAAFFCDTGAFYTGVHLGKHPVWSAVSPNKTVEGCLGGLALCMTVVLIFGLAVGGPVSWPVWLGLGLVLGISAQMGDFFESALKRFMAVKDSGTLLPGHGGILDRIDSLLFVVPVYAACRWLVDFFPNP